jgi:hypothetical protein
VGKVWGHFFEGFLLDVKYDDLSASLLGDLAPTNPPKRLRFGCFRWFPWGGVLEG